MADRKIDDYMTRAPNISLGHQDIPLNLGIIKV